jgi:tetrapyrrole methylase family protein / MazG family protein
VTPRITIVGLGPGAPELVTAGTRDAIDRIGRRFLRTTRHPSAQVVGDADSFDDVYDSEPTFEAVYGVIAERLVSAAAAEGEVLYAVPGSPRVLERTVDLLAADPRVEVEVLPALSFLDLAWVRLGVDPLEEGARLVDAHRFAERAAGERGPLLVAHCHSKRVLSDVKLSFEDEAPPSAVVLQRLGLPDEAIFEVPWAELDRAFEPDHLTALWIPVVAAPVAAELQRFAELVRTLRERCPWDREQTHRSLTRYLLEETYETLEAIEGGDVSHLEEELGDLLFQVVFHATIAAEAGDFTLADVARGIHDKLVHRHPHVFGDVSADDADQVIQNWEQIKRQEKGRASVMDGIPAALPSLAYAQKVIRKAGFTGGSSIGARTDEELGELLLEVAAAASAAGVDAEAALRAAAGRVRDRFMERERQG